MTWRQQADTTAVVWSYGYDRADQLTAAIKVRDDPIPTILQRYAYTYDPAGNRTGEQSPRDMIVHVNGSPERRCG